MAMYPTWFNATSPSQNCSATLLTALEYRLAIFIRQDRRRCPPMSEAGRFLVLTRKLPERGRKALTVTDHFREPEDQRKCMKLRDAIKNWRSGSNARRRDSAEHLQFSPRIFRASKKHGAGHRAAIGCAVPSRLLG
jgi:hypothetical protein